LPSRAVPERSCILSVIFVHGYGHARAALLHAGSGRASLPRSGWSGNFDGRIAQLVEQLTLNQRVQGSSPCAPTIKINIL